ncbi:MAG TPA: hypothetical protein VJV78_49790 [Polyangiales bacterium]|nr:hypothetical protein [Polyangiales bacterium]
MLVTGCGSLSNREVSVTPAPSPQHHATNRCYPAGKPAPAPPAEAIPDEVPKTNCRPLVEKKVVSTEQSLLRSYKRRFGHSRVIVDFPCDPVEQVSDIDLEFAAQASWLTLLHFVRQPESGDYEVRGIELRAPEQPPEAYDYRSAAQFQVKTASRHLGASELDLDGVRTPLAATINELLFSDGALDVTGFAGGPHIRRLVGMQGKNPHHVRGPDGLLQLEELTLARFERSYTGEAESLAQKDYLPVELAGKPLLAAVPPAAFGAVVSDDHRRLLRERMLASFDAAPHWLRELYLVLATQLGSPELITKLLEVAHAGPDAQRVLAVSALAVITGWDARLDAQGEPRPISTVAADYVQECSREQQTTSSAGR